MMPWCHWRIIISKLISTLHYSSKNMIRRSIRKYRMSISRTSSRQVVGLAGSLRYKMARTTLSQISSCNKIKRTLKISNTPCLFKRSFAWASSLPRTLSFRASVNMLTCHPTSTEAHYTEMIPCLDQTRLPRSTLGSKMTISRRFSKTLSIMTQESRMLLWIRENKLLRKDWGQRQVGRDQLWKFKIRKETP